MTERQEYLEQLALLQLQQLNYCKTYFDPNGLKELLPELQAGIVEAEGNLKRFAYKLPDERTN